MSICIGAHTVGFFQVLALKKVYMVGNMTRKIQLLFIRVEKCSLNIFLYKAVYKKGAKFSSKTRNLIIHSSSHLF